jgi:hypothetical protein
MIKLWGLLKNWIFVENRDIDASTKRSLPEFNSTSFATGNIRLF